MFHVFVKSTRARPNVPLCTSISLFNMNHIVGPGWAPQGPVKFTPDGKSKEKSKRRGVTVRIQVVGGPVLIALGSFFTECVVMSEKPFRFLFLKFYHACLILGCLCLFLLPLFFLHFLSPKILQRHRRTTVIPKTTYVTKCEHPTLDFHNSGFLVAEETKTKMGLLLFCFVWSCALMSI